MNEKIKYILLSAFMACTFAEAQENKEKKAIADFNSYAFAEAIASYESLVRRGYSSEEIFKNLGDANYQSANYEGASDWYAKLFELEQNKAETVYLFRYAQTLKSIGKYKESDLWMQKFEQAKTNDNRAVKFVDNPDYLTKIRKGSGRYTIQNLSINSVVSDFAPAYYGDDIVFSSARDTGRIARSIHEWNNKPFTNLYRATPLKNEAFGGVVKLSKSLNKKTHESSTSFTKDGKTLYFTRNNSENGRFARDKSGVSRLKIYRATLQDTEWTDIMQLPFNSDDYSTAHPTLSFDEKKLYFASDMPGTLGQSDIFVVDIKPDGSFGEPRNLGNKINTEGRETFPFLTASNILYFASDGHPGLGGLDIFAVKLPDLNFGKVVNVGTPINGKQDDFSFIINETEKKGYFASNREGGHGSDDIYGFSETQEIDLSCITTISGTIKEKDTGISIFGAKVTIIDTKDQRMVSTITNEDGIFNLDANCGTNEYRLTTSKDEYESEEINIAVVGTEETSGIELILEKTIKRAPVGTNLIEFLNLAPVHFELDKSDIRPDAEQIISKVITYLNQFPDLKLEVQSHTDAKANNEYNMRLSQRRAKATIDYFLDKGIDEQRISGIGYGETKLLNGCTSREKCEDTEHQINRRSEFIVVEQ